MTSVKRKLNGKAKKKLSFALVGLLIGALILGIKSAYAYYHSTDSFGILSALVGDFEVKGDINILVYRQNDDNSYSLTNNIPELGYVFDDTQTSCSIDCSNTTVNPNAACHYTYNVSETSFEKSFSLTSDNKVTCKFYFRKQTDADIKILVMKEDNEGTNSYTGQDGVARKYKLVEDVPMYGYTYSNEYKCDNNEAITNFAYDSETHRFNVGTKTKNVCYAYFNSTGEADATVNVYVQKSTGSKVYEEVNSIPANKKYTLAASQPSVCYLEDGTSKDPSGITYTEDGYINIADIDQKQTCNVYLDLVN